jgi:hypothetical protein
MDHEAPFQTRMSPSSSPARQNLDVAHDKLVMPSLGAGQRICELADHEVPFQMSARPSGEPAMQKLVEGHEMWLKPPVAWAKSRGAEADHEAPFQMKALLTAPGPVEPTATQKLTVGHETSPRPFGYLSICSGADQCSWALFATVVALTALVSVDAAVVVDEA